MANLTQEKKILAFKKRLTAYRDSKTKLFDQLPEPLTVSQLVEKARLLQEVETIFYILNLWDALEIEDQIEYFENA